ncbi:MAG: hypothetical protein DWI25_03040 [Planctomycetota bacterium]|nr:MAG: hypothetical protein DWI25_03040 [Planctomycetota bacterium]
MVFLQLIFSFKVFTVPQAVMQAILLLIPLQIIKFIMVLIKILMILIKPFWFPIFLAEIL